MGGTATPRARIVDTFGAVRRRVAITSAFLLLAHGALGALFGTVLAAAGDGGPWAMAVLAALGAAGSAAWTFVRLPDVAAGQLIERRFHDCRNVFITADEVLSGALEVNDTAADRVFARAADMLVRIDTSNVVAVGPRVAISLAVAAASAVCIALIWRTALSIR
ncbi:MAG: hypothetical protein M3Q55_02990 [Acidobacteriota bacterium]|nr:hypothetical protein [Acidobacteriota bacterium]